jgi:hypothetical protein
LRPPQAIRLLDVRRTLNRGQAGIGGAAPTPGDLPDGHPRAVAQIMLAGILACK